MENAAIVYWFKGIIRKHSDSHNYCCGNMAPRPRYFHPATAAQRNGDSSSLSRVSFSNRHSIDIVSAVALAALSAALAAVATAIGALSMLGDRPQYYPENLLPPTRNSIVSRTLRSTSLHTSVDYTSADEGFGAGVGQEKKDSQAMLSPDRAPVMIHEAQVPSLERNSLLPQVETNVNRVSGHLHNFVTAEDKGSFPMVAWLMSFPNSGTSYTLHLLREVTNTTTATNYGLEGDIKDEPSVPVHEGNENGPFLELIRTIKTKIPPRYILTKTHCTGFCADCDPTSFIETPRSFQMGCLSGRKGIQGKNGKGMRTVPVRYEADFVKKTVHLIRSPLDNIVARFHLEHKRHLKLGDKQVSHVQCLALH